jgi:hypothetical protein
LLINVSCAYFANHKTAGQKRKKKESTPSFYPARNPTDPVTFFPPRPLVIIRPKNEEMKRLLQSNNPKY